MTVSVVISARNEFPNIVHTIHCIINDLETFLSFGDFEIIVVDNLSDDENTDDRANGGTTDFLRVRSAYANRVVRVLYDPIAGNVSARNKGANIARGKYLFFSDAHMSYRHGTFRRMIETIDETGGMVHPAIAWMGSYPADPVYQYSWMVGSQFEGAWNNYKVSDRWFYVPAMGHCCLGMLREQFLDFRGYPDYLRSYGGGGMFLGAKWWMLGSSVVTEPRVMCYHLTAGRGYSFSHDDYIHNLFHSALILGADAWAERVYLDYLRTGHLGTVDRLWFEAEEKAQDQRLFMRQRQCMSFDDMLCRLPWDLQNETRVGRYQSGLSVTHDCWLALIKDTPAAAIYPGKHQVQLARFISAHLSKFVQDCSSDTSLSESKA